MTESCRLITTEQYQEYLKLREEDNHWHKEAERISHEAIGARLEAITLKKKLAIAIKALEKFKEREREYLDYGIDKDGNKIYLYPNRVATKALKEMEGVK